MFSSAASILLKRAGMRQLTFACAFLAVASFPMLANATSVSVPCTKPVVTATIPADGAVGVPIDAIGRVWLGFEEIDCADSEKSYSLRLGDGTPLNVFGEPYAEVTAGEQSTLPPNSEVELSLLEDGKAVFTAKFTTGSGPAAAPVAPVEAKLVSLTFEPVEDDGSHYHAFAHVRFRAGNADPFASGVLRTVGTSLENRAAKPGADGFFELTVGGLATASTSFCVEPGIENAAGEVVFGEPLCGEAPAPAGCSIGSAPDGVGGAAILAVLLGLRRRRR